MPIDEVREIIAKFNQDEAFIEQQLIERLENDSIGGENNY